MVGKVCHGLCGRSTGRVWFAGAVDLYHFSILESKIRGPCFKCIGLDFCKCLFREEKTVSAADLVYGSSADGTGFCWFVGEAAITYSHAVMQYRTIAFSLIFSGAFFFLQAMLPFRKIRIGISAVFYLIVFLLFLLPWAYFFASHSLLNASAVLAVFQTNPAEAKSYLVDFMPWQAWGIMAVLLAAYVFLLRQWRPSLLSMRTSLQNR